MLSDSIFGSPFLERVIKFLFGELCVILSILYYCKNKERQKQTHDHISYKVEYT